LAAAELGFATVRAPFDGIIDRLLRQQGTLVQEGEILTTLSDNSLMWAYFNVRERDYLEYKASHDQEKGMLIELELANHEKFTQNASNLVIESVFNNQTGVIPFRADFPNPERLLRQGQTGTVLISRVQDEAIVIPQRAVFEILDKQYVYVIDKDDVAHQREIEPDYELEDIYVIKSGLAVDERIVLEGARQLHEGDKVEYEDRRAEEVVAQLKYHAE
jgi:membrane fusion protein, multidrug efflux system